MVVYVSLNYRAFYISHGKNSHRTGRVAKPEFKYSCVRRVVGRCNFNSYPNKHLSFNVCVILLGDRYRR